MESARVDQWLWAVRVYKTRSAATDASSARHVLVNGSVAKAASQVRTGDRVEAHVAGRIESSRSCTSSTSGSVHARLPSAQSITAHRLRRSPRHGARRVYGMGYNLEPAAHRPLPSGHLSAVSVLARWQRAVRPSPCNSSTATIRPLNVRTSASIGPATSAPSPMDQSTSVALARRSRNSLCPGKKRLPQRSDATAFIRASGIDRACWSGRRISSWWTTMSSSIASEDNPGTCLRLVIMARKSPRISSTGARPLSLASATMNQLTRNADATIPSDSLITDICVSLTMCPTTSRTVHSAQSVLVSDCAGVSVSRSSSSAPRS